MFLKLIILALFHIINARDIHVLMTEVFEIVVHPSMFNWTHESIKDQFVYQASLLNAPDLPSWMNFVYSKKNQSGILYGVPPNQPNTKIPIEIIAWNKKNYETRIERVNVIILNKVRPARYEMIIKIYNLNVEDMFHGNRTGALKDVIEETLWEVKEKDLYITFLSSAVELGARKPLIPGKEEGVVVRLGSYEEFSQKLQEFEQEVNSLRKFASCDFKRSSIEVPFRRAGFNLDWCFFRLIYNNNSSGPHQPGANEKLSSVEENNLLHERWMPISKSDLPQRSYYHELLVSTLVPIFIMIALISTLSFILCLQQDDIKNPDDIPSEETNQFATIQRATESIRSFSKTRDMSLSPDPMLLSRSQTNSPTSTISRGVHCRPSPPPYVRPKFKPEL